MDDCIEWQGSRDRQGYGKAWKNGANARAHRVAWEEANGPIPEGMCVLHHCDNPPCINPDHLFLGTRGDNARDMVKKGRHKSQLRTECPQGHPLVDGNIYVNQGQRRCKTCHLARCKARRGAVRVAR